MAKIEKVAVLGAGVMGAAIAAHIANAGVPVALLDIVPEGAGEGVDERSPLATGAIARMLKTQPAPFMETRAAKLVTPGDLEDDLALLADADWICEAVVEDVAVKHDVYRRLDAVRKAGSIVSSNTSTIPLAKLVAGLPARFARDFAITHFFNPPRYMRLLEVVGGPRTRRGALSALRAFADTALGKEVVRCNDTPGFIANRIGIYWSTVAMSEALDLGLSVEEADAIVGRPMGVPKTGIFGLADLTGIDLAPHVMQSMAALLAPDDPFFAVYDPEGRLSRLIAGMIAEGYTGRKGRGGFYRLAKSNGARVKEARDLESGAYRPAAKPDLASIDAARHGLRALVEHEDAGGRYAWRVLSKTLAYAASLVPEIAGDIVSVDRAMRAGYAWKRGPFEQIDELGVAWFADRLAAEGLAVPALLRIAGARPLYREHEGAQQYLTLGGEYVDIAVEAGAFRLADLKRESQPIAANASASLWDLGDGVACLEFHSKMNALDSASMAMVREAAKIDKKGYRALVIGNDADNFSVGANVGLALFAANTAMWPLLEQNVKEGQDVFLALKYAPFPVVGAPAGMALGGGCEVLLHCDAVQAHAESYIGLVEVGVGLIPSWGGTKELILRNTARTDRPGGPMPPLMRTFETIGLAKVSRSAAEARELGFLVPDDGITMNRNRVLADAKARALKLAKRYKPPAAPEVALPGPSARAAFTMAVDGLVKSGQASAHDGIVTRALAEAVSGGATDVTETVSEKELLALERDTISKLIKMPATLDRIEHMLETGKPLRN